MKLKALKKLLNPNQLHPVEKDQPKATEDGQAQANVQPKRKGFSFEDSGSEDEFIDALEEPDYRPKEDKSDIEEVDREIGAMDSDSDVEALASAALNDKNENVLSDAEASDDEEAPSDVEASDTIFEKNANGCSDNVKAAAFGNAFNAADKDVSVNGAAGFESVQITIFADGGSALGFRCKPTIDDQIYIVQILPQSPAEEAELLAGDRIVGINGVEVKEMEFLSNLLKSSIKNNEFAVIDVERPYNEDTVKFVKAIVANMNMQTASSTRIQQSQIIDVNLNSSSEIENAEEIVTEISEPPAKKMRGRAAVYVHLEEVKSLQEVKAQAKSVGLIFDKTKNQVSYFKCRTAGCPFRWRTTVTPDLQHSIKTTEEKHNHGTRERKGGVSGDIKKLITERLIGKETTNSLAILQACTTNGLKQATPTQIRNRVSYAKRILLPNGGNLSFDDIEAKVKTFMDNDPDLMDFKFIVNEADPSKSDFAMTYTSKSLIEKQRQQRHAMVDGTYKLIYDGFVVLLFGYSDVNRHVHVTAVAIVSSESTNTFKWVFQFMKSNQFCEGEWCPVELMADNSRAIAAAAAIVFPSARKRSCFYHVIAACNKKFIALHLSKSETDAIKNEIYKLAYCSSEEHFDILAAAIIGEWQLSENENVVEFAEYFLRQYVQIDKFWFAANGGGCRTDNGIEACNHWMKDVFITKSLPIMQAADTIKLYLKQSDEKNYGPEEFEIVVTNAEWVAAYDFKKKTKVLHNTVKNCYYVRRSDSQFTDPEFFDFLNSMDMIEWDDEDVQNFNENVAVVTPSLLYDNQFTCNCPIGARRKLCKHILIIEVALKKRHFPDVAPMRQYLNEAGRNKRGRPRKFTPALAK